MVRNPVTMPASYRGLVVAAPARIFELPTSRTCAHRLAPPFAWSFRYGPLRVSPRCRGRCRPGTGAIVSIISGDHTSA